MVAVLDDDDDDSTTMPHMPNKKQGI